MASNEAFYNLKDLWMQASKRGAESLTQTHLQVLILVSHVMSRGNCGNNLTFTMLFIERPDRIKHRALQTVPLQVHP